MRVKSAVTSPTKGREGALDHHRVFFQNALNTCGAIVEDLMRDPAAAIFCRPVDPERDEEDFTMEDYLEVISTPMDLGEVMRKFRAREYTSAQHMREDVVQVWRNCYEFNGPDNVVYDSALALSELFDERFQAQITPPYHDTVSSSSLGESTRAWLGRRVKVYWKAEHAWFPGTIDKVDQAKGCHVLYDDSDEDWIRMPSVDVCLLELPSLHQQFLQQLHSTGGSGGGLSRSMYAEEEEVEIEESEAPILGQNGRADYDVCKSGDGHGVKKSQPEAKSEGLTARKRGGREAAEERRRVRVRKDGTGMAVARQSTQHHDGSVRTGALSAGSRAGSGVVEEREKGVNGQVRTSEEASLRGVPSGGQKKRKEALQRHADVAREKSGKATGPVDRRTDREADVALRSCAQALKCVMQMNGAGAFCRPLDEGDSDGHSSFAWIKNELNLRVILDKYSSGQYGTAHEMRKDITQVWRNCLLLSGPDAVLYKTAKTLACAFDDAYCQSVVAPAHQGEGWVVDGGGRDPGVGDGGLVGRAVSVYWACDHEWYCGKVTEHNSTGGAGQGEKYLVVFDGDAPVDSNWFELPSVDVCVLEDEEEEGRNGRGKRARKSVADLEGKDDAKETGRADHPQWCDCRSRRDKDGRWNLKAGDKVVGRYKDGNWYHAIVGRKEGDSYVLIWDDGDKDDTLKGMDEVCAPPPLRRDGEYDEQEWETYRRKKRDGVGWEVVRRKKRVPAGGVANGSCKQREAGEKDERSLAGKERELVRGHWVRTATGKRQWVPSSQAGPALIDNGKRTCKVEGDTAGNSERERRCCEVKRMTAQEMASALVAHADALAPYAPRLLQEAFDGEAILQLAWLLDPPPISHGAEAQSGGMAAFVRLVKDELGIDKQAHALQLAHQIRRVCAGAI